MHCGLTGVSSSSTGKLDAHHRPRRDYRTPSCRRVSTWRRPTSPRMIRAYTDGGAPRPRPGRLMNTCGPRNIRREYVEAFIVAELEPPSLGVRRDALPLGSAALQLAGRRERGRGHHSWPRCHRHTSRESMYRCSPTIMYSFCWRTASVEDFRNRRDCATIRPFLDSGMRLEDMSGPRHTADDPELPT